MFAIVKSPHSLKSANIEKNTEGLPNQKLSIFQNEALFHQPNELKPNKYEWKLSIAWSDLVLTKSESEGKSGLVSPTWNQEFSEYLAGSPYKQRIPEGLSSNDLLLKGKKQAMY